MHRIISYGVVTGVLLVAMIVMLAIGFSTPAQTVKAVTLLDYQISSNFSQEAYGRHTVSTTTAKQVYFRMIVDSLTGNYNYEFQAPDGVTDVKTTISINAVVRSQSGWQKEVVVLPSRTAADRVTVSFPIDLTVFTDINEIISSEIGMSPSAPSVTLRADVAVEAAGPSGPISESFTQSIGFIIHDLTLEWDPVSVRTVKGYQDGLTYLQEGSFGYTVSLIPNSLYSIATLQQVAPPAPVIYKIAEASNFPAESIEAMDIVFTHDFIAEEAVNNMQQRVEINGVLASPDGSLATFKFLPSVNVNDTRNISEQFSLDTALIYDLIQRAEGVNSRSEIGTSYRLNITAKVQTTGDVEGKALDKTVTNTVPVIFSGKSITWPNTTSTGESDTIMGTETVTNRTRPAILTAGYALAGFTLAFLLLTIWTFLEWRKPRRFLPPQWIAAQRIADKRKDIITDVTAVPPPAAGGQVMTCSNLAELVKLSDALLKPILHQVVEGVHLYVVVDGTSRYEYSVNERYTRS